MANRGFLITRGLLCKGLLVTRGLGKCQIIITVPAGDLRRTTGRGRSSSSRQKQTRQYKSYFVSVRLIKVNQKDIFPPFEGSIRVDCQQGDNLRVKATMPAVKKKIRRIVIHARRIIMPDDL